MSSYYGFTNMWHRIPAPIRRAIHKSDSLRRLKEQGIRVFTRNDMYATLGADPEGASMSASLLSNAISEDLNPASVLDVGCGDGDLLDKLRRRQIEVIGLEYSRARRERCRARQIEVYDHDIGRDPPRQYLDADVVVSLEVGEHLPKEWAERYIELLIVNGRDVVFSAATPGQGGLGHVNEQPHEFWIDKIEKRGLRFDSMLTQRWRRKWIGTDMYPWYRDNIMVFRSARKRA